MPLEYAIHSSNLYSILIQLQVEYVIQEFDLRNPQQAFEFLFQFYNFVSGAKTNASRLTLNQNRRMLVSDITTGLQSFTCESTKCRKDDGGHGDGRRDNTKRPRQGGPVFDQPDISHALAQRGYHVQLEEEEEIEGGWTPLDPVRHLSVKLDQVVLIDIGY